MSRTDYIIVSVCCITYNHVGFISDALDGFLMQSTNFPLEVIVHDDASTDGTADVIREYERRHPDVIKPIYQTENQYSKGIRVSATHVWPRARGKYIALCEGDDYWTDPLKLQKQVEFLEAHPECSMCFHRTELLFQATGEMVIEREAYQRPYYEVGDVLSHSLYIPTPSIMFRGALVKEFPAWYFQCPIGDIPLFALLAERGKLGVIDQVMSVHRVWSKSLWRSADAWAQQRMNRETFEALAQHFGPSYEKHWKIPLAQNYANQAKLYADLDDTANAKIWIRKSISTSFCVREQWGDQLAMLGRLYFARLYRFTKSLLSRVRSPLNGAADSFRNDE